MKVIITVSQRGQPSRRFVVPDAQIHEVAGVISQALEWSTEDTPAPAQEDGKNVTGLDKRAPRGTPEDQ